MGQYSIKDLEQITGVSAHTIRIWERRYQLITPGRTSTNIRYYSDADLRKLLNVAMLKNQGFKISFLARLKEVELEAQVLENTRKSEATDSMVDQLILAMVHFDEDLFEKILSRAIMTDGMENCLTNILYPFFERVGVLWQVGSITPAQEHFISNLLRQKLYVALDALGGAGKKNSMRIIFYLREGELHEIGLLFYTYLAKKAKMHPLYLGPNVPLSDLVKTCRATNTDVIFTCFTTPFPKIEFDKHLNVLSRELPSTKILITGRVLEEKEFSLSDQMNHISSPSQFKNWIKSYKSAEVE